MFSAIPECCRFANLRRRRAAAVGTGRFLTFPLGLEAWRLLLRRTAPHSKHAQKDVNTALP